MTAIDKRALAQHSIAGRELPATAPRAVVVQAIVALHANADEYRALGGIDTGLRYYAADLDKAAARLSEHYNISDLEVAQESE